LGGEHASTAITLGDETPPVPVRLERLAPQHALDAARLHVAAQPGTFLTALGPDILQIVYERLPSTTVGFGFAVTSAACSDERPVTIGFVSATTSVGSLFIQTGLSRAGSLAPRLIVRYLRHPALIGRTFQTVLYPFMGKGTDGDGTHHDGHEAGDASAELLSIMVEDRWRNHGVGAMLIDALVAECSARDLRRLDVTVDSMNGDARRFYERHGFTLQRSFRLYGRDMCSYGRPIPPYDASP
jgi:ribosomal protein S18 acetylase RimI-like enzyme